MLLWCIFLGVALAAPAEEFRDILSESEKVSINEAFLMNIVPSGFPPQKLHRMASKVQLAELVNKDNEYLHIFQKFMHQGTAKKGLTFNIYDENMREAAVALYRLLKDVKASDYHKLNLWASHNINHDIFMYAIRLAALHYNKFGHKEHQPPFITNPNYFVNSEAIFKANKLQNLNGNFDPQEAEVNNFFKTDDDLIFINANYSEWNLPKKESSLKYFREDIGLNSYYYGVHLLHPFWMSNTELDEIDPRHAEHYYFVHQQLMARYLLEMEGSNNRYDLLNDNGYNPYLVYENGLPFPTRTTEKGGMNDYEARIKQIDIAIKECISRGLIIMDNGTAISIAEDNHIDLLSKLIRANFDGVQTAKIIRYVYGYGGNKHPIDEYDPAPSVMHHPETSLRDPMYWKLINNILEYFTEYKMLLEPYNISDYKTEEFKIIEEKHSNLTTYFDNYQFDINKAIESDSYNFIESPQIFTVKQRRLNHLPFSFEFKIETTIETHGIVRLFLGPKCSPETCWLQYSQFFELDNFIVHFPEGENNLNWSPDLSKRFSFDNFYNVADQDKNSKVNRFNIFKFPESLLIPKGLEDGLELTLFVMVTPVKTPLHSIVSTDSSLYKHVSVDIDNKPLGFPFHRKAIGFDGSASNFKFYNVTVYHQSNLVESVGYFSPELY